MGRSPGARRCALAHQHGLYGRCLDDPDLHHLRYGRLCAGQKALCGPQHPLYPDRLRHGAAEAGHPDPPAARDEQPAALQHDLGGHLPHRRLAVRRIPDEAVQ